MEKNEQIESLREYRRLYYHKNKDKLRARREERKAEIKELRHLHYERNKDKIKGMNEVYRKKNKKIHNAKQRQKRSECPEFAAAERTRHVRRYSNSRRYRLRVLATNAKLRGKKAGMTVEPACFEPIISDPPTHCGCCSVEFEYQQIKTPRSPSIDRINNAFGYQNGNVAVICMRCNTLKKNGSVADFELILSYMKRVIGTPSP